MPFVSKSQQGYLHANPEVLGKKALAEWDAASKGSHDLPEHAHKNASYKTAHESRKKD
ncbi:Uncharacterised protein [uncultured archaeon]|nr:Uncharacterised protein [uncultured archaeon]